ncbi:hypothetical protein ACEZCY_35840 [Streptacidiphilus sp. N1-12]|uniref:Uncharacterized protein n=1 Tax=Streptacidiphilus alkalitolerans TaxID=3342712 RepID=A0ABV6WS58_9ACTN
MNQPAPAPAPVAVLPQTIAPGDYVIYRDARRYLSGQNDHTYLAQASYGAFNESGRTIDLVRVPSGERISNAPLIYMRRLDPSEAMADIDNAPLDRDGLKSAALTWLRARIPVGRP